MDEAVKTESLESHLSSAAAFVEGGIQEACDDACSICLEEFCESDPSTVTGCKHEFHLQCILEWCQRSSQCPMCWQSISLKDPTSQELLEAVEREKSIRSNRSRNTAIFHHPTLGDIELQHLPVGANDAELEERIFQHLAAAAAMGRAHLARREGRRGRSGTHGRPQYLVFSSDPNAIPVGPIAASSGQRGSEDEPALPNAAAGPSVPLSAVGEESSSRVSRTASVQSARGPRLSAEANNAGLSSNWSSSSQPVQVNQDRAGPSDFQSFSESLKSRLSAVSMKYKESITKSTRGWKERFFSRSTSVSDIGSEDRREVNAGIATVSRMIEHLDTRENYGIQGASETSSQEAHSVTEPSNERSTERESDHIQKDLNASASCAAASGSTQVLL